MSSSVARALREARHRQRLDVDEVARRAGVPASHVAGLEHGDLSAMGDRVRAKATVRAVARALDVDAEPLLLSLDAAAAPAGLTPRTFGTRLAARGSPHGIRVRWILGMVAVVLLVAVLGWLTGLLFADSRADTARTVPPVDAAAPVDDASLTPVGRVRMTSRPVAEPKRATVTRVPSRTSVQVLDASGRPGALAEAVEALSEMRYDVVSTSVARDVRARTAVYFNEGWQREARALVGDEPRFGRVLANDRGLNPELALHVVVGQDWPEDAR